MAAATKHARTTSPLPRCNGGRWRRWRPHARTRMHTAPLSAPNGSRPRGGCPRRCDPARKWSTNRVYPQRKRPSRRSAAPPPCHCVDDHRGARTAPPRPFSKVSQVARPRRTPQKQAAALDRPIARGESGGRLSCLSRSWAQQATPSVVLRSTRGLPGPLASLKRHRAPCATCGARSAVHGGRPIEGVAGEVHSESASDQ